MPIEHHLSLSLLVRHRAIVCSDIQSRAARLHLRSSLFPFSLLFAMVTTKEDVAHLERAEDTTPGVLPNTSGENLDDDPIYTRTEQRKIIHRVDRRLITIAGTIYMNSLMDRSNLPNAGIAGMNLDLEMINMRYVCIDTKRKFLSALALTI